MSQILRDLNKLAEKMGAPVVGQNISEQVRAISTFYGGTSHGANINERINEVRQAYHGDGDFTIFELVDGIAKSLTDEAAHYLYNAKKENISEKWETFSIFEQLSIGLYILKFSEKYNKVRAGIYFDGNFKMYKGIGHWYKTEQGDYTGAWYSFQDEKILYNTTAFNSFHPAISELTAVGKEIPTNTVNDYLIGDVFDTGITAENNIMILRFYNGEVWIYRFPKNQVPTATISSGQYLISVSGSYRTQIDENVGVKTITKNELSYVASQSDVYIDIPTINEVVIAVTFDLKTTDGKTIIAKNADIDDYI